MTFDWADVYVFCVPTRYGNVPSQIKQILDSAGRLWLQGKLDEQGGYGHHQCHEPARRTGNYPAGVVYHHVPLGRTW
jgi:multimeric flavodoxin WrbA